ncbi:MAG: SCO family protein [Neisseriaceae bacterium]|nr:SCO family protein [Neisseriaceae bacterium]
MKKNIIKSAINITLIAGLLISCTSQESNNSAGNTNKDSSIEVTQTNQDFFGSDVSDKNFGIDFSLQATTGKKIALHDTHGKVTILVFGYTHCPDVCPTNLFTYANAMEHLGELSHNVQLYFITVDPERDTPEKLEPYITMFNPNFIGLVPDSSNLEEVKKAWNITSAKVPTRDGNYNVDHSAGTYLIDKEGKTAIYEPHSATAIQLANDLRLLLNQ